MTTNRGTPPDIGLDRLLTDWLEADAAPRAPQSLETAFIEGVADTRPRSAWATTERWISMETRAQLGAVPRVLIMLLTIAVLAALALGTYVVAGGLAEQISDAPSRANGLLTFASSRAIWATDFDSGSDEPQRLTDETEYTSGPEWSPDGSRFVYGSSTTEDGPSALVVRDADGSDPIRLTPPIEGEFRDNVWSPDGTTILYATSPIVGSCWKDYNFCGGRMYRVPADGSAEPEALGDPDLDAAAPVFAPDGSFVVFVGSPAGSQADYRLYRMNLDGSHIEPISELSGDGSTFWRIEISPDGRQIVTQAGGELTDIYVVDIASGKHTVVAEEWPSSFDASWSPDGSRILFSRNESPTIWAPQPVLVDAATLESRPLDVRMWARDWSPDGSSIYGRNADDMVIRVDVDGDEIATADIHVLEGSDGSEAVAWQAVSS